MTLFIIQGVKTGVLTHSEELFVSCFCRFAPDTNKQCKLLVDIFYPEISRVYHFVKKKKLPFSIENVKTIVSKCNELAHVKTFFLSD